MHMEGEREREQRESRERAERGNGERKGGMLRVYETECMVCESHGA